MDIVADNLSTDVLKARVVLVNGKDVVEYFEEVLDTRLSAGVKFIGEYNSLEAAPKVNGGIVLIGTKDYIYSETQDKWHEIGDEGLIGNIVDLLRAINDNIEYLGSVSATSEYQLTANPGSMAYENKDSYLKEVPNTYKTYALTKISLSTDGYVIKTDIPTYADISSNINLSDYTQLTTTTELQQNCEKTEKVVNEQVLSYKTWNIQYTPASNERTGGNSQMANIPDYYTIFFTPSVYRDSVNAIKKFTVMMTSTADQIPAGDVYIKLVDPTTHKVLAVTNAVQCSQNATVEFTFNKLAYLDPHKEYWLKICTTPDENTYEDHVSAFGIFVLTKANNPAWTPDLHYINTTNGYLSAFRPVMTITWTDNKINDYVLKDSLYNEYSLSAAEGIDTAQTDKGCVPSITVCLSAFDNDYESITQLGFQRRDSHHASDAYLSNLTLYAFGSTAATLTNLNESNTYLSSLNSVKYPEYNGIVAADLTSTGKILPNNTDYLYFYFLSTDVINSESLANYSKYSIGIRQYRFNEGKAPNYISPSLIYLSNIWYPAISIKYKKSKLAEKLWVEDKLGDIESALDIINNGGAQ